MLTFLCAFMQGNKRWPQSSEQMRNNVVCCIANIDGGVVASSQYQNWRAKPLTSRLAVVELIAATTTTTGLKVACELDTKTYDKGVKVTKAEMATLNLRRDTFHPEWNYAIIPRQPT